MKILSREEYENDARVVLTLDAGGTNLVFTAIKGAAEITEPHTLPSYPRDLKGMLKTIEEGFREVAGRVGPPIHSISFAFPGPADYRLGIIGDLPNLPAFRGGVALGSFLKEKFSLPVYINNDANLFVLGEYIFGFLPLVNAMLKEHGADKRYRNLTGVTLGSGFGCGLMIDGRLNVGDNSNGGELWLTRNKLFPELCVDASVGQEKIRRFYSSFAGVALAEAPSSEGIFHIAKGTMDGNRQAAEKAFRMVGEIIGDALANTSVLMDGLIVIGGGLTGASDLLMPEIMKELNSTIDHLDGAAHPRIAQKAFNLEDKEELKTFLEGDQRILQVPFSKETLQYDALQRIGVGISGLGTSRATALGAYVFALSY
jgi:glucokinase